ncbi:MAG: hypothetical protein QOE37_1106 [Microbacteriaceae bacterium]|nr:hypothetical protein [Microbacteriaceae bacterium]
MTRLWNTPADFADEMLVGLGIHFAHQPEAFLAVVDEAAALARSAS